MIRFFDILVWRREVWEGDATIEKFLRRDIVVPLSIAMFALGAGYFAGFSSEELTFGFSPGGIGYSVGYFILPAVILSLICVSASRMSSDNKTRSKVFLSILVAMIVGAGLGSRAIVDENMNDMFDEAERYITERDQALESGVEFQFEAKPNEDADGLMARAKEFQTDFLSEMSRMSNSYTLELEAAGYFSIVDPTQYANGRSFEESLMVFPKVRKIMERYAAIEHEIFEEAVERARHFDLPSYQRTEFVTGLYEGREESRNARERNLELESQIVSYAEKIVIFLSKEPRRWELKGSELIIADPEFMIEYNQYRTAMEECIEEQSSLQAAQIEAGRKRH